MAHAGAGAWTTIGPGPDVTAVAVDSTTPATLYAGSWSGGVYKSTDFSATWAAANSGLSTLDVRALAINPAAPATLYAGMEDAGGVFKSTNSGGTWAAANTGLTSQAVYALAIDPATPATVYAGTYGSGVYRSTNSGTTWVPANAGLANVPVFALAIDPTTPSTVYAGTWAGGGIFKSTNSGGTWSATNSGLTTMNIYTVAIDPMVPSTLYAGTFGGGVFKSTNSGSTWTAANAGLSTPPCFVHSLAIDPSVPATVYAGILGGGVYKSIDSAGTWAAANTGMTVNGITVQEVTALALDPTTPSNLYAGTEVGVWQWQPGAVKADLDGDGLPDIVFRSNVNGLQNKVWSMNGTLRASESAITPDAASVAWKVRGVSDFDLDGHNDLVFWNQNTGNVEFWLMNGTVRTGAPTPLTGGPVLPTNWDLSATADFNGDGRPDIVWRNLASQEIVIWAMNGSARVSSIVPIPDHAVASNWTVVAARDYNADGHTDFLWYNSTSGKIVTWYMDETVVRITGQFTAPPNAGANNWKVMASSDYSGASGAGTPPFGSPDIVWRNDTSGSQVIWHMDSNSTRVHGEFTSPAANIPPLDWTIVGPR